MRQSWEGRSRGSVRIPGRFADDTGQIYTGVLPSGLTEFEIWDNCQHPEHCEPAEWAVELGDFMLHTCPGCGREKHLC